MKQSSYIFFNDRRVEPGTEYVPMLWGNYVYAAVNTHAHAAMHLGRQLDYAAASYEKLYGTRPRLDEGAISARITELLEYNNAPRLGNVVNIIILPGGDVLIIHDRSTIYRGYELLSLRPKVMVTNYGLPLDGHRTALSLTAARYMDDFAKRGGRNIALHADRSGRLVSAGDYPVFVVKDSAVTTPTLDGRPGCVERELMLEVCRAAEIAVAETEIGVDELAMCEEVMIFGASGIHSVLSCGDTFYYNLTALRLERELTRING